MNLYLISQTQNNDYDTYDAAVVCAPDEETARNMNPSSGEPMPVGGWRYQYSSWCSSPDQVRVEFLAVAKEGQEKGVILASFNAG